MIDQVRRSCLCLALLTWLLAALPVSAFSFVVGYQYTLTADFKQAEMVLVGRLTNPNPMAGKDTLGGTTDLVIETIIKKHDCLKGRKVITLPCLVTFTPGSNDRIIVCCDLFKGKVDPWRGLFVRTGSDSDKYVKGVIELKDENPEKRLRFFFDYLDNPDPTISGDAFKEFDNAGYAQYQALAPKLPADRIVKALKEPKTPGFTVALYARLLGHCGKPEHAAFLRSMLNNKQRRCVTCGTDGILAGYILLKPREGWEYLRGILNDSSKEFLFRNAALRAAHFFWDYRSDVISKDEVVATIACLLKQKDAADLAIDTFRSRHCWDMADRIVALQTKEEVYSIPDVRRAILRYALCVKNSASARCYVQEMRRKDPEAVKEVEEFFKEDQVLSSIPR